MTLFGGDDIDIIYWQ
jgi:hypothetical protein